MTFTKNMLQQGIKLEWSMFPRRVYRGQVSRVPHTIACPTAACRFYSPCSPPLRFTSSRHAPRAGCLVRE